MSVLRLALAQVTSTMDRLANAIRVAAGQGAGLVSYPELSTTSYFCVHRAADGAFERVPDGPTTREMCALARELGVVLVVPLAERDSSGGRYNSAVVIDSDGTVAGTCRKRHLPHGPGSWEHDYFQPGDGPAVFATAVGRLGVAICWDRYFPETWQALARDRAELTVVPIASTLDPGKPAGHARPASGRVPARHVRRDRQPGRRRILRWVLCGRTVRQRARRIRWRQEELILRDLEQAC
ncbi:carbon-nitrogen hydrolase family protein [Kribbella sp. VKM Ac-2566]|uniref:carbon-nitrogen hydrolase family protein n=1 Tax=Kribbella sp. VKM Ac-2566 TaxID=2512218 RepID=UPI001063EA8B|nr:nitrilase-related carbon-nitrogen hydrolase [Kribbella sp. VKM Ac-2566]